MKKILIGTLIILLTIMAYFAVFKGISIGSLNILSVTQIQEENNKLEQEIATTETLMKKDYPVETEKLEKSVTDLLTAKEEYQDLENVSTESEIIEASKQETYKIEYLWARIGNHATSEGVTLKLDVTAGGTGEANVKNLSFTISGSYIAIMNFITAIEDDDQLGFRIENFKILQGSGEGKRQATFTAKNVRIQAENITSAVKSTDTTSGTNTTTQTQTNTTNQANTTTQTDAEGQANTTTETNTADQTNTTTQTNTIDQTNTTDQTANETGTNE